MAKAARWLATSEWKKAANAALKEKPRGTQNRMAAAIGCDPSMITHLLKGDVVVSELVGPISDYLGIYIPLTVENAEEQEFLEMVRELPIEEVRKLIQARELFATPPKKK